MFEKRWLGTADAAEWVYQHGLEPGEWTTAELITMTELGHMHRLAMAKVWEVAPHPDATEEEGPGSFRRHGIKAFVAGMQPPEWTEVPALMADWIKRACVSVPKTRSAFDLRIRRRGPTLDARHGASTEVERARRGGAFQSFILGLRLDCAEPTGQ